MNLDRRAKPKRSSGRGPEPVPSLIADDDFIDFNRTFIEVDGGAVDALALGYHWGKTLGKWLSWTEILQRRRVVLLAESGSGKSREFQAQSKSLALAGHFSVCLSVISLSEKSLWELLPSEQLERFSSWLTGPDEATFFLDSVDEARLFTSSRFEQALLSFRNSVPAEALGRARIFVSCRASDWRWKADRRLVESLTPPTRSEADTRTQDEILLDILSGGYVRTEKKQATKSAECLVLQFAPLLEPDWRLAASERSVSQIDAFVKEIHRLGLEPLASRPGELVNLIRYWSTHDRLGSLSEMLEHSINQRLVEENKEREVQDYICLAKLREGAEKVAGVMTLSQTLVISMASDAAASETNTVLDFMKSWGNSKEVYQLLRRGLFSPATNETIRFYHRTAQEYLAARWLVGLAAGPLSNIRLEDVLFCSNHGGRLLLPALAPVAAWAALQDEKVLQSVIEINPLALINFGDPASLSLPARAAVLESIRGLTQANPAWPIAVDLHRLPLFAHEHLGEIIRTCWRQSRHRRFRWFLLDLLIAGKIKSGKGLARKLFRTSGPNSMSRIYALQALGAVNDKAGLRVAASYLVDNLGQLTNEQAAAMARVLFPGYLSVTELLAVIGSSTKEKIHSVTGFAQSVQQFWGLCRGKAMRLEFLSGISELCFRPPLIERYRVSERYYEMARHLSAVLKLELEKLGPNDGLPIAILSALRVVRLVGADFEHGFDQGPTLSELINSSASVKRALILLDSEDAEAPEGNRVFYRVSAIQSLWKLDQSDLSWLLEDSTLKNPPMLRSIAFAHACRLLKFAGQLETQIDRLSEICQTQSDLAQALDRTLTEARQEANKSPVEDSVQDASSDTFLKLARRLRKKPSLLNPENIRSRKALDLLWSIANFVSKSKRRSTFEQEDWTFLIPAFGESVALTYKLVMQRFWRETEPTSPKFVTMGTSMSTHYTLEQLLSRAGVELEAQNPDWLENLSEVEYERAIKHTLNCCREVPSWLDAALAHRPEVSEGFVKSLVRKEWNGDFLDATYLSHFSNCPDPNPWIVGFFWRLLVDGPRPYYAEVYRSLGPLANRWRQRPTKRASLVAKLEKVAAELDVSEWHRTVPILALLFQLDWMAGVSLLRKCLEKLEDPKRSAHLDLVLGRLFGSDRTCQQIALEEAPVEALIELIRLDQEHPHHRPRQTNGIVDYSSPTCVFPPDAEHGREAALKEAIRRGGLQCYRAVSSLSLDPLFSSRVHELELVARAIATTDVQIPWTLQEIQNFENQGAVTARSAEDFHRFACNALASIDIALREEDFSLMKLLQEASSEEAVQHWLADQLHQKYGKWFKVIREAEVADRKKPDLLLVSWSGHWEVAVEVKQSESWSIRELEEALADQLGGQYLRPLTRRHGILVLTQHRSKVWEGRQTGQRLEFPDVIEHLRTAAAQLSQANGARVVTVSSISALPSACRRSSRPTTSSKYGNLAARSPAVNLSASRDEAGTKDE